MSLDDCDVVAEAKSPFSTSATDTPRRASSRATPAPAMPPPTMTTSYSASSSGQGRPIIRSGDPADSRDGGHGGHDQPRGALSIALVAPPGRRGAGRSPPPTPVDFLIGSRTPRPHRTARRRRPSTLV